MGFKDASVGVAAIRSVAKRFPDDSELLSIPMWIRENRSRPCPLEVGDATPNVPLAGVTQTVDDNQLAPSQETTLLQFCRDVRQQQSLPETAPVVVVAGSVT